MCFVRGLPRTNSIHFLKNGWRKDENLVDIFQRLRGIIYVLLSELCAKDSTTVEGITPSTLKISTESSVNSGARNQESGCKQRERERERHQLLSWRFGLDRKLHQLVIGFTQRFSTNFYSAFLHIVNTVFRETRRDSFSVFPLNGKILRDT